MNSSSEDVKLQTVKYFYKSSLRQETVRMSEPKLTKFALGMMFIEYFIKVNQEIILIIDCMTLE